MADVTINIPGTDPDPHIEYGDLVTINFTAHVLFVNTDPKAFIPEMPTWKTFHAGDTWSGMAVADSEDVKLFWLDLPGKSTSMEEAIKVSVAGMKTIHIGSTLFLTKQLEKELENDAFKKIFCDCWPCTQLLIEAILNLKSLPIPIPVKKFLELLVTAGKRLHATLCPKPATK